MNLPHLAWNSGKGISILSLLFLSLVNLWRLNDLSLNDKCRQPCCQQCHVSQRKYHQSGGTSTNNELRLMFHLHSFLIHSSSISTIFHIFFFHSRSFSLFDVEFVRSEAFHFEPNMMWYEFPLAEETTYEKWPQRPQVSPPAVQPLVVAPLVVPTTVVEPPGASCQMQLTNLLRYWSHLAPLAPERVLLPVAVFHPPSMSSLPNKIHVLSWHQTVICRTAIFHHFLEAIRLLIASFEGNPVPRLSQPGFLSCLRQNQCYRRHLHSQLPHLSIWHTKFMSKWSQRKSFYFCLKPS